MSTDSNRTGRARTVRNATIGAALTLGLVACSTIVLRQGWDPAYGPVVPHDTFPADCALCHVSGDWHTIKKDFVFDHEKETGVPLVGAHGDATCLMCHNDRGPVATFVAQGCAGCHEDVHRGQLGRNCADCHNEQTWVARDAIARHNRTRFPLVGAHAAAACFRCHEGAPVSNFTGLDTACTSCHQADLARALAPDHAAQGWVDNCQRCHVAIDWTPARFAHPASFPLAAGHAGQACTACHQGNVFTGLSTDCVSCHQSDFNATTSPNHNAAGFSTDCRQCHTTTTWQGATFNHPASFPLTAGHAGQSCNECHQGGVFTGLSTACVSCHQADYNATMAPNHAAAGYSTNCTQCHTTAGWAGAAFNHPASFPLTAGHAGHSCNSCHQGGVFTGLSTTCVSCHQADYNATTSPNHAAAGYSTNCTQCHTTAGWSGAAFTHPASFPLTFGHAGHACNTCHVGGVFTGLSTACASCHLDDYQATTNPNHALSGLGTTCASCHRTTSWTSVTFTHTVIITSGPHQRNCNECHQVPGQPSVFSCTHCHEHSQSTMADKHSGVSGYAWVSTTCLGCHPTGR